MPLSLKQFLLVICLFAFTLTAKSQTAYTWNGVISTAWNIPGNWTPNGIPGATDNVTVVTGSNTCLLNASAAITNITINSGILDLGGFTLTAGGATALFSAGTVQNGVMTVSGATTTTFGNGPLTMNCVVNVTSASVTTRNTVFQNTTTITKTGASSDVSIGNNMFNGALTINSTGTGYFMLGSGNPDQFNAAATFNNTGSNGLFIAYNSTGNVFGGVTTFNNSPTTNTVTQVSWFSPGTIFKDNIVVTSTSGQGVQFCGGNITATASLSAGKTISVGAGGFSIGTLLLRQFTQTGATAQNISLTGSGNLTFGPSSLFGGNITAVSPTLFFYSCNFNGTLNATKTGVTSDNSNGNIFNGATTMTNAGSGYLLFGFTNPDQFNATSTFNNTGSNNIYVAYNSANNVFGGVTTFNNSPTANTQIYVSHFSAGTAFNDNIVVSSTTGQGVQFCLGNATATAILAATKTITVGAGGFSAGTLLLKQFTQTGATAQTLSLTGTGNLTFGPSSAIGGNLTATSPTLLFNGCNFSGTVTATKTGATSDRSKGNNIFNGAFSVSNTGTGYYLMGDISPDLWQATATFNNLGTQNMYTAYNSAGNIFNGDVVFNNQPATNILWIYPNSGGINTQFNGNISVVNVNGAGVSFGSGTGTAVLASGKAISAGAGGFNSGGLVFRNFTQTGVASPQTITTTGTSYIQYGTTAVFDGALISSSPGLSFDGCTFNSSVNATKTGSSNDYSNGNNIFNAATVITNNGIGFLVMTNLTADNYNADVAFVQNNTGGFFPNFNGNSNYAGNLTITSPAATAIVFGSNTGTATFSGAGAQTISVTGTTPTPVFTRLVINNSGGGVTLNNTPVNVSVSLVLTAGLLNTTTSNILTMLNGSTTTAGTATSTSYVNGPMRYQKSTIGATTLNFPIGNGADCRPVALTVNHTTGNLYTYQAQLLNASAIALGYALPVTVTGVSGFHYYTITRVNAASVNQPTLELSGNQTIQLFFGSNDLVTDGSTLSIVKNTFAATTTWIDIGGAGGPAYSGGANLTGSITSTSLPTAFNSFSTFSIANKSGGSNALPIELLYFNAKMYNGIVKLAWATSVESNDSYFTIERSSSTVDFRLLQKISTEALGGNSSVTLNYIANDVNPYSGLSYYRLKQTDLDGNYTYSDIVAVNFDKNRFVSVYPNPTRGTVNISGVDINQTSLKVEWFDISGRSLLKEMVPAQNGIATLNEQFTNGVYLLRITTSDGSIKLQNVIIMK